MRVGVAGFLHESNTFLGVPTEYSDFEAASLTRGQAVIERWRGAHHELGGFVDGLTDAGFETVPLLATYAVPSGTIGAECYERIVAEMLEEIQHNLPLDGLLLALHGATVSADFPDADGELLFRIRKLAGDSIPIVTTLDLHANVSQAMINLANATIAYRTNPHLDQRQRGLEAVSLMARILRGEIAPVTALETPPMLIQISKQHTASPPARLLYDDLEHVLTWPGILTASIAMGFYYADVAEMGASFFATANGDEDLAAKAARYMAARAWERRHELAGSLPSPADAVRDALRSQLAPIVLMDVGDNVGAGSPGDSTILFREIQSQKGRDAMVILHDPAGVKSCLARGPGQTISIDVGRRDPVRVEGTIRTLSDGRFVERQVRHGGWGACDQGLTAVIETAEGHTVILTSRRMAPMSLEQVLSLGVRPEQKKILIVKGVVAPRAAYEPIAAQIVLVDTPGVTSDNPRHFVYRNRRTPLFPLEAVT
jgi:microcystin degradation protein MlrC